MPTLTVPSQTHARANWNKVNTLLEAGELADGMGADLYRTVIAGPSGQRADVCVGRIIYRAEGPYEFEILTPDTHLTAGYVARRHDRRGNWTVWEDEYEGSIWLKGWSASVAIAADVLVNGAHVALGRHDSGRISQGGWVGYVPQDI